MGERWTVELASETLRRVRAAALVELLACDDLRVAEECDERYAPYDIACQSGRKGTPGFAAGDYNEEELRRAGDNGVPSKSGRITVSAVSV
jgi:hypothetical protein